jgi:hypothetical protein
MDVSYVTAFAALGGVAFGGFTSFTTSWTTLRAQMKAQQSANSKSIRQDLHKGFTDDASRNRTLQELESMIHDGSVDLLRGFSDACREEFETNLSI